MSHLVKRYCKCIGEKIDPPTPTPDTSTAEVYKARVLEILSSKSIGTADPLDIGGIIKIFTTFQDFPSFNKQHLMEALKEGVEEGSFVLKDGQYLLNTKEASHDDMVAEEVPDPMFGASANNNFSFEQHDDTTESQSRQIDIDSFFSNNYEWPIASAKYFSRDIKCPGDGKRGLVFNSLIDKKRISDFSSLHNDELDYHFHVTHVHHGITLAKSKAICTMSHYMVQQCHQEKRESLEANRLGFSSALHDVLSKKFEGIRSSEINTIVEEVNVSAQKKIREHETHFYQRRQIEYPVVYNRIRTSYLHGNNSIVKNLPMPKVDIVHGCAHIAVNQIVNHFLALGIDIGVYRAGYEEDWLCKDGKYESIFMSEVHESTKALMRAEDAIPKDTRVCMARIWSDGFEAHHVAAKNGFNSLQLFTLSLLGPNGRITKCHTWPCALCFKAANSPKIFLQILEELHELKKPTLRYWGKDKQFFSTIVYLDMVSQDYPERCSSTCTSNLGSYTHRWRHSCKYDDNLTPSCKHCEWNRINHILDQNDDQINHCSKCLDWWDKGRKNVFGREEKYPIGPGEAIEKSGPCKALNETFLNTPSVEISFKLMENSTKILQEWIHHCQMKSNFNKRSLPGIATTYLRMLGLPPPVVQGLVQDICNGKDAESSESYPLILRRYKEVDIEMKKFQTMPMHMLFLGIEKSLISKTHIVANRRDKEQNNFWRSLTESMQRSQKAINSISVSWCMSMSFSGKDEHSIGTAGWQSEHYVAFTRLSLFHFGPIVGGPDIPQAKKEVIKQFIRVRVTWFCLISHLLTDGNVSSNRINHYVKLFLSSCRRLWQSAQEQLVGEEHMAKDVAYKRRRGPMTTQPPNNAKVQRGKMKSHSTSLDPII